jgi:hypothetical protein
MKRLHSFLRLSWHQRSLVVEAAVLLGIARVMIHTVRFDRLAPRLGRHMAETPDVHSTEERAIAREVRWAVASAVRNVPFEAVCFPQAIAAMFMLRRRGVASTLYLGVNRDRGLDAHAWVRAGRTLITGGAESRDYSVISTFA